MDMRVSISILLYSTLMACTPMAEPPPLLSAAPSTPGRDAFAGKRRETTESGNTIEGLTREMLEGDIGTATLGFMQRGDCGGGRLEGAPPGH